MFTCQQLDSHYFCSKKIKRCLHGHIQELTNNLPESVLTEGQGPKKRQLVINLELNEINLKFMKPNWKETGHVSSRIKSALIEYFSMMRNQSFFSLFRFALTSQQHNSFHCQCLQMRFES